MNKKILVIDDDEAILDAFEAVLQSEGYYVQICSNPEGLLFDKHSLPDLILLDALLSGIDGRDVCKKLKSQDFTQKIPVIMISAATNIEKSIRAAKADDFIAKPFDIQDLLQKVKKYIGPPN